MAKRCNSFQLQIRCSGVVCPGERLESFRLIFDSYMPVQMPCSDVLSAGIHRASSVKRTPEECARKEYHWNHLPAFSEAHGVFSICRQPESALVRTLVGIVKFAHRGCSPISSLAVALGVAANILEQHGCEQHARTASWSDILEQRAGATH